MDPQEALSLRRKMVEDQIEARGIKDPAVLSAMRTVPRHLFVPESEERKAYRDRPLPIGEEQTISQPYIVAAMTELLQVGAGDHVLEVGCGSGYQAAVLAEVCSRVTSVEVIPELAERARALLARLRYDNVTVHAADGALGWPEDAPYAGVMVTCGAERTPPALLDQVAPGGRVVIPVGRPNEVMELRVWQKADDGSLTHEDTLRVRFVPLVTNAI